MSRNADHMIKVWSCEGDTTHCTPSTAHSAQYGTALDRNGCHTAAASHIYDHRCGLLPTQQKVIKQDKMCLSLPPSIVSPSLPPSSPSWCSSEHCTCVSHNSSSCCRHAGNDTPLSPPHPHTPPLLRHDHTGTARYASSCTEDNHQGGTPRGSSEAHLKKCQNDYTHCRLVIS